MSAVVVIVGAAAEVGRGRPADSVYRYNSIIIYRTTSAPVTTRGVGGCNINIILNMSAGRAAE